MCVHEAHLVAVPAGDARDEVVHVADGGADGGRGLARAEPGVHLQLAPAVLQLEVEIEVLEVAREHAAGPRNPKLLGADLHLDLLGEIHGLADENGLHGERPKRGGGRERASRHGAVGARKRKRAADRCRRCSSPPQAASPPHGGAWVVGLLSLLIVVGSVCRLADGWASLVTTLPREWGRAFSLSTVRSARASKAPRSKLGERAEERGTLGATGRAADQTDPRAQDLGKGAEAGARQAGAEGGAEGGEPAWQAEPARQGNKARRIKQ